MDWGDYPNFSEEEFACSHTGEVKMLPEFMARLQRLRTAYGKPMVITSGYRSPEHPLEADKKKPGVHTLGCAADVAVHGQDAYLLVKHALECGFTGIGVSQRPGKPRFIHLDLLQEEPRPNIWSY